MPDPRRVAVIGMLVLLASVAARTQPTPAQHAARTGPEQPLPYSHKAHVALGLTCRVCHVNPDPRGLMTFPPAALCMGCHQTVAADRPPIQQLAAFAASSRPVPWVRVYKLPDYVYWRHATHLDAQVACAECHGPVPERDVIAQETNVVTMAGCLSCHYKRQVFTDCADCHAPRQ